MLNKPLTTNLKSKKPTTLPTLVTCDRNKPFWHTRLITVGDKVSDFIFPGRYPKLKSLQKAVNGWIEEVPLLQLPYWATKGDTPEEWLMFVNEEGILEKLPTNKMASMLVGRGIVGNVIVSPRRLYTSKYCKDQILCKEI